MGNIYDGAFRTILNDCRQMIIPVINGIFKEDYTGNEIIEFHPNEHFIDQQDAADKERITDANFIIYGNDSCQYLLTKPKPLIFLILSAIYVTVVARVLNRLPLLSVQVSG